MFPKDRFVAVLCLAAVLLAALAPPIGGPLSAVLVAVVCLFGVLTATPNPPGNPVVVPASPFVPSLGSRAPPLS